MDSRYRRAFALAATCVVSALAMAATSPTVEKTPIPVPPKPNFSSMNFLLGTWTCSTKSSRRPAAYITTSTASVDPTGYWIVTKSLIHKTAWTAGNLVTTDMETWDDSTHRWIDMSSGDQGLYSFITSPGWNGNSMTWTDAIFKPSLGTRAETPLVLIKVSNTKTTSHTTFQEASGRWVSVDAVCTKGNSAS